MPRSRSRSSSSRGSAAKFSHARANAAKPVAVAAQVPVAYPVVPSAGGGGVKSAASEGVAFGLGSALSHAVLGKMLSGGGFKAGADAPAKHVSREAPLGACAQLQRDFAACLAASKHDVAACQAPLDAFSQCQADGRLNLRTA